MSKFYGLDKFEAGQMVEIANLEALNEFARMWKFHHPLQPDQFQHASRIAEVTNSLMYHGGDILYEIKGIPGVWLLTSQELG